MAALPERLAKSMILLLGPVLFLLSPGGVRQEPPHAPCRPAEPFRVHVPAPLAENEFEGAALAEAREEILSRFRKNRGWFRVVDDAVDAKILVHLRSYWKREEQKVLSVWGVVSPVDNERAPVKT